MGIFMKSVAMTYGSVIEKTEKLDYILHLILISVWLSYCGHLNGYINNLDLFLWMLSFISQL